MASRMTGIEEDRRMSTFESANLIAASHEIGSVAIEVAKALTLPNAIVIGVAANGDIIVSATPSLNHRETVEKLAVAIHATLSQHDELVREGAAGAEPAERFNRYAKGEV